MLPPNSCGRNYQPADIIFLYRTTLIISKKPGNTGISRDIRTEFTTDLEQAFKEFTAKKLKQQERPSIRKTLAVLKEKAAARSSQQAKEKIKERGLSR